VFLKLFLAIFFIMPSVLSYSANAKEPVHHIFFVHGLAGDANTFGSMPAQLIKDLSKFDEHVQFESHIFHYPTENNKLQSYDFASDLAGFVKNIIPTFNKKDKISFVAHSQGGLISSIVLFKSFAKEAGYLADYTENFKNFITLGTPFWGSKLADIISYPEGMIDRYIGDNKQDYFPRAGEKQLIEMSLFSKTIKRFRESVLNMDSQFAKIIFSKVRVLNIGGVANLQKLTRKYKSGFKPSGLVKLLPILFGGQYEYEADTAVSIPSSQLDSIYVDDVVADYHENRVTPGSLSYQTHYADNVSVYGIHASPKANEFYDIAFLPSGLCPDIIDCIHPTYEIIYRHFAGLDIHHAKNILDQKKLSGFVVSFDIQLPAGHRNLVDEIEIERIETSRLTTFPKRILYGVNIKFDKFFEIRSNSTYIQENRKNFHFTGAFHYLSGDSEIMKKDIKRDKLLVHANGAYLTFKVALKGFKSRIVKVLVKPTKSTFIKLNLEPKE